MKHVVITGASRGLGLTVANEFLAKGWKVTGTGRSLRPDMLNPDIAYQQFDSADAAACESFWQQFKEAADGEVCLVNNAGSYVAADGGLTEAKPEDFERQIQSVYLTSVYMTQGLVKHLSAARIINVVSSSALLHDPTELAYGSAKDAQRHFFQTLQETYKPEQYQITNLYPDYIATHEPNPDAMEPQDLAAFISTLADSQASYYLRDVTAYPVKRS